MIKLLIGGSPCTHWSIAQKNNRETEPSGMGWELFKNYLIAKEKFKPDFFLYENNKSAAQPIKDQISLELGVPLQYINSALVSAQNRQRFYAHNIPNVPQPKDRGILLRDILESGVPCRKEKGCCLDANYFKGGNLSNFNKQSGQRLQVAEPVPFGENNDGKAYCLDANYYKGLPPEKVLKYKQRTMAAEPVCVAQRGRYVGENNEIEQIYEVRVDGKTNALTTVQKDNAICESVIFQRPREFNCGGVKYNKALTLTANGSYQDNNHVIQPIRVGCYPSPDGTLKNSQGMRLYSVEGKSVNLTANGGGMGAKTGLYAIPVEFEDGIPIKAVSCADGKEYPVYEVKNGQITIKDKQYDIKLQDGYYIIRKLTVTECCRLQTMPDDYCKAVSKTQGYKGLGNGWTAEVIIHILKHMNIPLDEKIQVLSMYDGIGTGRYCLDKMGYKNIKYVSYEIDKYAMQIANSNYAEIIQKGDAFQLRNDNWCYPM